MISDLTEPKARDVFSSCDGWLYVGPFTKTNMLLKSSDAFANLELWTL